MWKLISFVIASKKMHCKNQKAFFEYNLYTKNRPDIMSGLSIMQYCLFKTISRLTVRQQLVNRNDFFFIVRSACFTYSVRHHKSTTFAAFYKVRSRHFPVCSSLIASCFGRFILRTNGHSYTSLNLLNISLIAAIRGSSPVVSQSQV